MDFNCKDKAYMKIEDVGLNFNLNLSESVEVVDLHDGRERTLYCIDKINDKLDEGLSVLFFTKERTFNRIFNSFKAATLDNEDHTLSEHRSKSNYSRLDIDDSFSLEINYIAKKIKEYVIINEKLDYVIIDGLDLVSHNENVSDEKTLKEISKVLNEISNEIGCEITATVQLN